MTLSSVSTFFLLCAVSLVHAHVRMVHPTPRTDNEYLYTFDEGVCGENDDKCAGFCGDPYDSSLNPLTILQVGVPQTLRWSVTQAHRPEKYRLSLNPTSRDERFDLDDNILATVTNSDAADPGNVGKKGDFSTTVTIPESALDTCSQANGDDPCVLQLFDLYYFVSCANVLLTTEDLSLSAAPSTSPSITCVNSRDYKLSQEGNKGCAWVMRKPEKRRQKLCRNKSTLSNCPISCGLC